MKRKESVPARKMKRLDIEIFGVTEVRWLSSEQCQIDDNHIYYAENDAQNHYNSVAIIPNEETPKSIISCVPISDRVIFLQPNSKPFNVKASNCTPTRSELSDDAIKAFYKQVETVRSLTKKIRNKHRNAKLLKIHPIFKFCQDRDFVVSSPP